MIGSGALAGTERSVRRRGGDGRSGEGAAGDEHLGLVLVDALPCDVEHPPRHLGWRGDVRIEILCVDVERAHGREAAGEPVHLEQHPLDLAVLAVDGEQREAPAHLVGEESGGLEGAGHRDVDEVAALVESDVQLTGEEHRLVPALFPPAARAR